MTDMHVITNDIDKAQGAIEQLKRAVPAYIELATINAKIRRAHYTAYLAEGFTEDQALILCQKTDL